MANEKITLYKLITRISKNKAPKKVRITGNIYEFDEELNTYITHERNCRVLLGGVLGEINLIAEMFNEIVEILPEDYNKWKDIKQCSRKEFLDLTSDEKSLELYCYIRDLIKDQEYLKERLEENE